MPSLLILEETSISSLCNYVFFHIQAEFHSEVILTVQWFSLLPSVTEVSADSEVSHVMSSSHTLRSSHWEAKVQDGEMDMDEDLELSKIAVNPSNMCQQFNAELKKKFQVGHTHTTNLI